MTQGIMIMKNIIELYTSGWATSCFRQLEGVAFFEARVVGIPH
jgi:hypothetical protein